MKYLIVTGAIFAIVLLMSLITMYRPETAGMGGNIPCPELDCKAGKIPITLRTGSPIKQCVCAVPLGEEGFVTYDNRDIQMIRSR